MSIENLLRGSLLILITIGQSCNRSPDLESEKREILLLHDQQRKAHFEKNVDLLLGDSSIDFIEINRGVIKKPTRSESFRRFQAYFDDVDFIKWDDITPPEISFSNDATMATSVVNKLVVTKKKVGNNPPDTTYFAWLAVYKKDGGKWKMHRIVSTNK